MRNANVRGLGTKQGDAIRKIVGGLGTNNGWIFANPNGAFYLQGQTLGGQNVIEASNIQTYGWFFFDSSRVVPTGGDNRPVNIAVIPRQKR